MVLWLPQILYPTSTLLTRFSPGLPVLLQEIFYQPSFALISLLAKDNAFSKKTTFFLLAHGWSVLILLFCLYVFFRFFFGVLPSCNCENKAAVVLREKNLFSWQNVWNSRQIATDIKEKLGNQEEVPCGGIRLIYLPFLIKRMETMPRSYQQ